MPLAYERLRKAVRNIAGWKITAYLFLAFSVGETVRILPGVKVTELQPAAFFCLGMIALSVGRLCGVAHPYPAPEVAVILFAIAKASFMDFLTATLPAVDEFLLAFDRSYGYAGMLIGQMFYRSPVWDAIFRFLYYSLMLAIPLLYLGMPTTAVRKTFARAMVLAAICILPFYALCPGAGPVYLLRDSFPWGIINVSQPHVRTISGALNTTPSGHFAWALLMFWFARKYCTKPLQIATGIFMVSMCIATLGTGEHYIVDLVLAAPFAAGIWALAHRQWRSAAVSMAVVLVWLMAL